MALFAHLLILDEMERFASHIKVCKMVPFCFFFGGGVTEHMHRFARMEDLFLVILDMLSTLKRELVALLGFWGVVC